MRILLLTALFVLPTACSDPAPPTREADNSTPALTSSDASRPVQTTTADDHAKPDPGELGTFKDWTVGCDNGDACKAVALMPEDGEFPDSLMSIGREGGSGGGYVVRVTGQTRPVPPVTVQVDGRTVAVGGAVEDDAVIFRAADAHAIAREAANGTALTLTGAKGATSTLSLAGLSAALRYMDAEQGLAGTRGAIVARGDAQPGARADPLPVIHATPVGGTAVDLGAGQIAPLRKRYGCAIADYFPDPPTPESSALGDGKTLVLLPCDSGAYNLISVALILDGTDAEPVLAKFDAQTGMGEGDTVPQVVNAGFDKGVLGTFGKGRGLGDCGIIQQFVWDGAMFRLSEQSEMGECRGSIDYITTWRARVVR